MSPIETPPAELLDTPGNCGLLAAWYALRFFGKRVRAMRIAQDVRHTKKHGTFMVALAAALQEYGLCVSFHTDPDPAPHRIETAAYRRGWEFGMEIEPAATVEELRRALSHGEFVIVLTDGLDGVGHISAISALSGSQVEFVEPWDETMPLADFEERRAAAGVYRQAIVVHGREPCG